MSVSPTAHPATSQHVGPLRSYDGDLGPDVDEIDSDDNKDYSSSRLLEPSYAPWDHQHVKRRKSIADEAGEPPPTATVAQETLKDLPVTWRSLPRKGQLAILAFARLSDAFTQMSLTAYLFYQLKSFDTTLADSTIAAQGGMIQAAFPAAQLLTAVLWGRAADTDWIGRKRVLLIGLFSTGLTYVGYGFSKSFAQAMMYQVLGGALNGNMGVIRTLISETVKEKRYGVVIPRLRSLIDFCLGISRGHSCSSQWVSTLG
jgi:hypothetical protein